MEKISKNVFAALAVSALLVGVYGCKKQGTPNEDLGRKMDQSIENTDQKINTAVDKFGQKVENTGQKIQGKVAEVRK